jgi:hypothetical protein
MDDSRVGRLRTGSEPSSPAAAEHASPAAPSQRAARRRLAILLLVVALWPTLLGVEAAFLAPRRDAARWTWPQPAANEVDRHERLGALARSDGAELRRATESAADPLVILAGNRCLAANDAAAERLRSRLGQHGVVAAEVLALDLRWATLAQRALAPLASRPGTVLVLAMGAEDMARASRRTLRGVPLPSLRAGADGIVAEEMPPSGPARDAGGLAWLPIVRCWLDGPELLPRPGRHGVLPLDLWPHARGGTGNEDQLLAATDLALRRLRDDRRRASGVLLVVWTPSPLDTDDQVASRLLAELDLDTTDLETKRGRRLVTDLCAKLEVPFVDPTQAIARGLRGRPSHAAMASGAPLAAELAAPSRDIVFELLARELRHLLTR